ncbi:methyltransferase (TIGR00027 family) [Streptomyces sp. 846.5]|nr:methyltransferase (TIGR00027 family) [Streptomyces sp. 846.5]
MARCERITVAVDLREDWPAALAAAGHDPAVPTVWIAEGLLIYLPEDAVELLLARISAQSAAGSRMGADIGLARGDRALRRGRRAGIGGVPVGFGDARGPGGVAGRARLGGQQPHPARARCRLRPPDQHPAAARGGARRTDLGGPPVERLPVLHRTRRGPDPVVTESDRDAARWLPVRWPPGGNLNWSLTGQSFSLAAPAVVVFGGSMDSRALRILTSAYWEPTGWLKPAADRPEPEDRAYAEQAGYMFAPLTVDHDELITRVRAAADRTTLRMASDAFGASLSSRSLHHRPVLSSPRDRRHPPRPRSSGIPERVRPARRPRRAERPSHGSRLSRGLVASLARHQQDSDRHRFPAVLAGWCCFAEMRGGAPAVIAIGGAGVLGWVMCWGRVCSVRRR